MKKILLLVLLIIILITGCTKYDVIDKKNANYPPIDPFISNYKNKMIFYYPDKNLNRLIGEERLINYKNKKIEEVLIYELLEGSESKKLTKIIPRKTKLLSIKTIGDITYVNFSKHIKDNIQDDKQEAFVIFSIVNTLTQLNNIEKVQILIDGEINEVLCKYYSIEEPLVANDMLTEIDYSNPIEVVYQYYNILKDRDYSNLNRLFLIKSQIDFNFLIDDNENIMNQIQSFNINNYTITRQNRNVKIRLDIRVVKSNNQIIERKDEKFNIVDSYQGFKIDSIVYK